MSFQRERGTIRWKVHFSSPRGKVFDALATDAGRSTFWAENTCEEDGEVTFHFLSHEPVTCRILRSVRPSEYAIEYFGAPVQFQLEDDGEGGTDLRLYAAGIAEDARMELVAGWVSVLLTMKGAVDFGIDLRNHDATRTWADGYADN